MQYGQEPGGDRDVPEPMEGPDGTAICSQQEMSKPELNT